MKNRIIKIGFMVALLLMFLTGAVFAGDTIHTANRVGIFEDIDVPAGSMVMGNTITVFGNVGIKGQVNGNVVAVFGDVNIEGSVMGNTVAVFGSMRVGNQAMIAGNVVQVLGKMKVEQGARIAGQRLNVLSFSVGDLEGSFPFILFILFLTIGKIMISYVFSILAVALFPNQFQNMAHSTTVDTSKKLLIGLLVVLGYYILAALLVVVIIGIPFLLLLAPLMALLSFTGNTAVKLAIGQKIAISRGKKWSQMMELFVGSLVYGLIEITVIGKVVIWVGRTIGIGALIDTKLGNKEPHGEDGADPILPQ